MLRLGIIWLYTPSKKNPKGKALAKTISDPQHLSYATVVLTQTQDVGDEQGKDFETNDGEPGVGDEQVGDGD